jgi:hypothetical protein
LGLEVDYLTGTFTQGLRLHKQIIRVSVNVNPKINFYDDDYKLELGAIVNHLSDVEAS